jgi:SAM-dependent methyltransferase
MGLLLQTAYVGRPEVARNTARSESMSGKIFSAIRRTSQMLKNDVNVIKRRGINFLKENGGTIKFKPWLGDLFSFLYDSIMKNSIFPKKFEASIEKHLQFLGNEYKDIHNSFVLELATGSGNLSKLLPSDNEFVGVDISEGLLKIAHKNFTNSGFKNFELFLCGADKLPFEDDCFDISICNLSLNFFPDLLKAINEIKRTLKKQGVFICSVPVPERNKKQSVIRGKLYSENELKGIFEGNSFSFIPYDLENGALLYFKAISK